MVTLRIKDDDFAVASIAYRTESNRAVLKGALILSNLKDYKKLKTYTKQRIAASIRDTRSTNKSTTFNAEIKKVDYKDGIYSILIIDRDSSVTYSKTDEQKKKQIIDLLQKRPIPVDKDLLAKFLLTTSKPLKTAGSKIVDWEEVFLPKSNDEWERYFSLAQGAEDFLNIHKRIPQIDSVCGIFDVKNFNFKQWVEFLKGSDEAHNDNKEMFMSLPSDKQIKAIDAFEVFGNSVDILDDKWHIVSLLQAKRLLTRLSKEDKQRFLQMAQTIYKKFIDTDYFFSAMENLDKLFEKQTQNIKNKNWAAIEKFLTSIVYTNVQKGAEELAFLAGRAGMNENAFQKASTEFLKSKKKVENSPVNFPTIKGDNWEIIRADSPKLWVAGQETHCCMTPYSIGWSCVTFAADHPDISGLMRVFDKAGKTIAQSFLWLDSSSYRNILVLDNIEVLGDTLRDTVKDAYLDMAEKVLDDKYKFFRIKQINVGSGFSDINLEELCDREAFRGIDKAKIPEDLDYTDAKGTQWILKIKEN